MLALSQGLKYSSIPTGLPSQLPYTIPIRLQQAPIPSWAWANLLWEEYTRCPLGKVISRITPQGTTLMPTHPARCTLRPNRPSCMPSYPAPRPPVKDPASSKGSRTWPPRPQSGPTNSSSLRWLSSFSPPRLVSLLGCPCLLPPSTPPLQTPSFSLPPYPPLALETSYRFILSLFLATAVLRRLLVALGELGMFVFLC